MTDKTIDWNNNPVLDISRLVARLTALLQEETTMLRNMKIADIEKLQAEKSEIADALQSAQRHLSLQPGILKKLPEQEKKKFESLSMAMAQAIADNYKELTVAREVNKKIVELIARAVTHNCKKINGYNNNGLNKNSVFSNQLSVPAVSCNHVV